MNSSIKDITREATEESTISKRLNKAESLVLKFSILINTCSAEAALKLDSILTNVITVKKIKKERLYKTATNREEASSKTERIR
ncbi:hypothetical protein [Saccharolobus shibatae]|uniref:Uncharacterized protein n=1 Tax=Saccharolobus shibatae TaxID=2286 RepID=A0A8F5C1L7_9CREN|nr:hypothetical protein [Saccharolobus shibatae]QXJ35467.1 hypothetical protein J5U22_02014 [Saccharolobus shibatae]